MSGTARQDENRLFPVFLKLETLRLLIVGAGNIGLEKLNAVISNSPETKIKIVALEASKEVTRLALEHNAEIIVKPFEVSDLENVDLVIAATGDRLLATSIAEACKKRGLLLNVADTPTLCDFYLGAIVQKGQLKIAISTNGKSPTIAKRVKEMLQHSLPDSLSELTERMGDIRNALTGDFAYKVAELDRITAVMTEKKRTINSWPRLALIWTGGLISLTLLLVLKNWSAWDELTAIPNFYSIVATGFFAQLIAGALGMGYGVICTAVLLSFGVGLPAISSSIHSAETVSSGISGLAHFRYGNVEKKLLQSLILPGIAGAVVGALLLSAYGDRYANIIRPIIAVYTLFLGAKILASAFRGTALDVKIKSVPALALAGGFIDSFGGGGWGPLVTSSFIAEGRKPRLVVGSVGLAKFFVSAASAATFFLTLGIKHSWQIAMALLIGGVVAAPISAKVAGALPVKTMYISVGVLVIACSLRLLAKSL